MKLSARNQFEGKVAAVEKGVVNGIVSIDVNGTMIKSTISNAAIDELGLKEGVVATAVIKATEVMIGKGDLVLSARNKLAGKVIAVEKGAVNSIVKLDVFNGQTITATISNAAVEELGLAVGEEAVAVIKATSVMVGC